MLDLYVGQELFWTFDFLLEVVCSKILVSGLLLDSPIYSGSHRHINESMELIGSSVAFILEKIEEFKQIAENKIHFQYTDRNFLTVRIICVAIFEHINDVYGSVKVQLLVL